MLDDRPESLCAKIPLLLSLRSEYTKAQTRLIVPVSSVDEEESRFLLELYSVLGAWGMK